VPTRNRGYSKKLLESGMYTVSYVKVVNCFFICKNGKK